ncbi:tRNA (adenosine(37)-N6)-threonylcarbamoyltransferase complex transferase subunit TsaD [archaeon]|nr:tRNA (adenosine(37)-N6)-threonylcarbamoyltransferase complex transferase subunit TsaD [archaeon]MDD2477704.1 KEOPS complex N(6)-L-threonylcarbamoyladenine synthase Kae1 [Candidatus ainarchaeum sp.]MDD3084557.1 KEOPS complex N(6)-L-threonylcarbamoyladenine synthase Kae1 [Candidatus ainarchaeum sp.]MDD4221281.1 KEOPS complex N(6)-L-threonylcarbamoyladenine synthase Kae1 [Candidatus ainarchaeum sp.]MDD4662786.1 KEOPS complex N(6)-L-threonylcarbamoyladenine synthase Kae1 [Candidatus ainarchaeum 
MICLGIESTAHTLGIGIIDSKGKVYTNSKRQYVQKDTVSGIKPYDAAQFHYQNSIDLLKEALEDAKLTMKDIHVISFSKSPGLGPCLVVGATFARTLAIKYNKPIVGVNHCVAHLEIGKTLMKAKDPLFIYTSGANTQIIARDDNRYKILGETLDIGLGNLFDSFARDLGYGFPGGPILDQIYFKSNNYLDILPYSVKGMDIVYSGLLTSSQKLIGKYKNEDLVYSFMHTAYAMLLEVCERAISYTNKKEIMVIGGVAASKALKEMLTAFSKERKVKLFIPPVSACLDNGLMIADLGLKEYLSNGGQQLKDTTIDPTERTDQVIISW